MTGQPVADSPIDRCPNFVSTDHTGNTIVRLLADLDDTHGTNLLTTLTDPITEVLDHLGRLSTVNDAADVRLLEERLIVLREQLRVLEKEQAGFCEKLDHVCGLDSYFDNIHEIKSGLWKNLENVKNGDSVNCIPAGFGSDSGRMEERNKNPADWTVFRDEKTKRSCGKLDGD